MKMLTCLKVNNVDDLFKKKKKFVGGEWEWESSPLQSESLYQAVVKCSWDMRG